MSWLIKAIDGAYFFLIFKACQYLWDRVFNSEDTVSIRLSYLENQLAGLLIEVYEDEPGPDYEALTATLSDEPIIPPHFFEVYKVKEAYIV